MHPENYLLFKLKKIFLIIIPLCTFLSVTINPLEIHAQGQEDPGYYPPYVQYHINIRFRGQLFNVDEVSISNEYPQYISGVKITVWVRYDEYDEITGLPVQREWSDVLYSSATGRYDRSLDLYKVLPNTIIMGAEYTPFAPWILADSKITSEYMDTDFVKDFYFIPLMDGDGNGIRDEFELQLAKKFAPTMIPNHHPQEISPEPVQIMGGTFNSKIYATVTDNDNKLFGPWPAELIDRYNYEKMEWERIIPENIKFGRRCNYSNLFASNPEKGTFYNLRIWGERNSILLYNNYSFSANNLKIWYHLDWEGGNDEHTWWSKYQEKKDKYSHTIYSVLWNDFKPVIQYWFFYPYNDFSNDHEGDWEHINVIINSQIPEDASIDYIEYYFHNKYFEVTRDNIWFFEEDTEHPVVFIGGYGEAANRFESRSGYNSGGSYPWPGKYSDVGAWGQEEEVYGFGIPAAVSYSFFTQDSTDDMPNDSKGLELLKDLDYFESIGFFDNHPEYSWLSANIRFGEPKSQLILSLPLYTYIKDMHSIVGPVYNPGWKSLGPTNSYSRWTGDYKETIKYIR